MGVTKTGKGILRESSDKLTPWRNAVCTQAIEELQRLGNGQELPAPFSCPVEVALWFTFLRPKSISRSKRPYMSIAPDLSKLIRSTEDGLTDAGVWVDDALVVTVSASKNYVNEGPCAMDRQGVSILVRPVVSWEMPPGRGRLELEGNQWTSTSESS